LVGIANFEQDLKRGERFEEKIDEYFVGEFAFNIRRVNMTGQRSGIDRTWTNPEGITKTIEYKADTKAAETGNVFIEIVSNDRTGKAGWAFTSQADFLVYLVVGMGTLYFCEMAAVKKHAEGKWQRYRRVFCKNVGKYSSEGLLVPLDVFQKDTRAKVYREI